MKSSVLQSAFLLLSAILLNEVVQGAPGDREQKVTTKTTGKTPKPASKQQKTTIKADFKLPPFTRIGTPRQIYYRGARRLRKPIYLPEGAQIVSRGKAVTASDSFPIIGTLSMITDGNKAGTEGNWVELGPGLQWVQIDLGKPTTLYGVLLWHYHGDDRVYRDHGDDRVYRDVIVQVANNRDFTSSVTTLFNNDGDNSSGRDIGRHNEYYERHIGEWIAFQKTPKARYLRLYSRGNTSDPQNQYIEAEVWGDLNK